MRILLQRVSKASVIINSNNFSSINKGLLVFLGIQTKDTLKDVQYLTHKLINLRIFNDDDGLMNLSVLDKQYSIMLISQFTLYGNCKKGNRPSFLDAASSEHAKKIYNEFVNYMKNKLNKVQTGIFGAHMVVELINDGPVTFILDSNEK